MKTYPICRAELKPPMARQSGLILIVVLVVMTAMIIASVGLLRSNDTATAINANIGIKKDSYRLSSRALQYVSAELEALRTGDGLPFNDIVAAGYYASAKLPVDSRGVPLMLVNAKMPISAGVGGTGFVKELVIPVVADGGTGVTQTGGYVIRYVAQRACATDGAENLTTNPCRSAQGASGNSIDIKRKILSTDDSIYTEVTVRIDGPRQSTSYFQFMLL